jgi:hypothetical protein
MLSGTCKLALLIAILHLPHAKFTKKADVFAAGIIFLELISLSSPRTLFKVLWPRILEIPLPSAFKEILRKSLAEHQKKDRVHSMGF